MPAIQRSEFALALNQVAAERGVDASVVLETVKNAILAAYRKDHPGVEVEDYKAELDPNTGEAKIFQGEDSVKLLEKMRKKFSFVKSIKPTSSKKNSKEIYYVGLGFK